MANPDSKPPELEVKVDEIPGPDFTIYSETLDFITNEGKPVAPSESEDSVRDRKLRRKYFYSGPVTVRLGKPTTHGEGEPERRPISARALACRAYGGRYWSITIRSDGENRRKPVESGGDNWVERLTEKAKNLPGYATEKGRVECKKLVGYCPRGCPGVDVEEADPPADGDIFLNEIHTVCEELKRILFDGEGPHPHGLIAITGATDSSKSLITRGLIFLHLQEAAARARQDGLRKPHLVTFEDPIEKYYVRDPQSEPSPNLHVIKKLLDALYIDYTPREKDKDAGSLKQVTKNALRQTPSVLFVGETREQDDWKDLLEFAGSNHLVITTSHASSVVEAISSIFRAADVKTPARRSEVARRILGVINIRSFTPENTGRPIRALLPAMWKRTPQSMNNLIADGLASVLPERKRVEPEGQQAGPKRDPNYYGRSYFVELLTSRPSASMNRYEGKEAALAQIKRQATEWDLKGE